tara:strand:- start:675 stop:860 length:186 start_codon:yes stop_codon:yes gene_type:complete
MLRHYFYRGLVGASCRVRGRGNGPIDGRGESRGRVQPAENFFGAGVQLVQNMCHDSTINNA